MCIKYLKHVLNNVFDLGGLLYPIFSVSIQWSRLAPDSLSPLSILWVDQYYCSVAQLENNGYCILAAALMEQALHIEVAFYPWYLASHFCTTYEKTKNLQGIRLCYHANLFLWPENKYTTLISFREGKTHVHCCCFVPADSVLKSNGGTDFNLTDFIVVALKPEYLPKSIIFAQGRISL